MCNLRANTAVTSGKQNKDANSPGLRTRRWS
jgi:hypothetical protein